MFSLGKKIDEPLISEAEILLWFADIKKSYAKHILFCLDSIYIVQKANSFVVFMDNLGSHRVNRSCHVVVTLA